VETGFEVLLVFLYLWKVVECTKRTNNYGSSQPRLLSDCRAAPIHRIARPAKCRPMYDASKKHGTAHEKCTLPSETIFREHTIDLGNGALRSAPARTGRSETGSAGDAKCIQPQTLDHTPRHPGKSMEARKAGNPLISPTTLFLEDP